MVIGALLLVRVDVDKGAQAVGRSGGGMSPGGIELANSTTEERGLNSEALSEISKDRTI